MTVYEVFPTCVGVFPRFCRSATRSACLPHVRGGVSQRPKLSISLRRSSPRAWGCFRLSACLRSNSSSLPHVRGGVSTSSATKKSSMQSSPRAWGCFFVGIHAKLAGNVFPTCVGVFPSPCVLRHATAGLPHVRGGVSHANRTEGTRQRSSPRAWGCFCGLQVAKRLLDVFPTCVGVFPQAYQPRSPQAGLPHVRGGVSSSAGAGCEGFWSSPRAWGCFPHRRRWTGRPRVFPTCVGVFPG